MNATQTVVTGIMAILMLGTILMMPSGMPGRAAPLKRIGVVAAPAQVRSELPPGEVKDLTY
jgi:hypothetical protein